MTPDRSPVAPPTPAPPSVPPFDVLFREEAAYVGRTLRYLGVKESHVEDACQETFLVVHRRLSDFHGGSLRAWIRQICIHIARNHRRALGRRPEEPTGNLPDPVAPADQHGDLERRRLRDRLLGVLDELPDEQRAAFVLFEIERLSMAETADAMGCPLQTAYSRLHAARSRIQAAVREEDP
jgi:RNA polymerase sigma-70 factor (ECF subfamily)